MNEAPDTEYLFLFPDQFSRVQRLLVSPPPSDLGMRSVLSLCMYDYEGNKRQEMPRHNPGRKGEMESDVSLFCVFSLSSTVKNKLSMHSGFCVFFHYIACPTAIQTLQQILNFWKCSTKPTGFSPLSLYKYEISTRHSSLIFSILEKLSTLDTNI